MTYPCDRSVAPHVATSLNARRSTSTSPWSSRVRIASSPAFALFCCDSPRYLTQPLSGVFWYGSADNSTVRDAIANYVSPEILSGTVRLTVPRTRSSRGVVCLVWLLALRLIELHFCSLFRVVWRTHAQGTICGGAAAVGKRSKPG